MVLLRVKKIDQSAESVSALLVLLLGRTDPASDVGIGGNAWIRCSSA
jgi:hypothetical protein